MQAFILVKQKNSRRPTALTVNVRGVRVSSDSNQGAKSYGTFLPVPVAVFQGDFRPDSLVDIIRARYYRNVEFFTMVRSENK